MRARKRDAFAIAREFGLGLPDVEEGTMYGAPALKLDGKLFACMATNKSADPESLIVQVGFVNRDLLVAKDPDVYYFRKHYASYPVVLVRLNRVSPGDLHEVLEMAHRYMSSYVTRRRPKRKASQVKR